MGTHTGKNMNMIGHAVYLYHFVLVFLKDACPACAGLMQSFFPVIAD